MAIYHYHKEFVKRSKGQSATAAAAYRAGERIYDEREGKVHDYTRKGDVVHTQIYLPDGAPEIWLDRVALWNAAEAAERAKNARVAISLDIALPVEMSRAEWVRLMEAHSRTYTALGYCADIAIHDNGLGNPHAHVLLTARTVEGGLLVGAKPRDWGDSSQLLEWRGDWARDCNSILAGRAHIDHRTLKAQGLDREPAIHMGPTATQKERRGERTERGDRNREIAQENARRVAARMAGASRSYADTLGRIEGEKAAAAAARRQAESGPLLEIEVARRLELQAPGHLEAVRLGKGEGQPPFLETQREGLPARAYKMAGGEARGGPDRAWGEARGAWGFAEGGGEARGNRQGPRGQGGAARVPGAPRDRRLLQA